ncbi:tRNA (guanosine(37)-N1)-methyltransferase TrmD [Candidatus Dependentiae bacterium]|nr:tRNA (guanosine(37)-N1)-methyltransferase TrmD [Candidatus Dependentiae bacterium]
MVISTITLFPELYKPFLETSLIRKAQEQQHVTLDVKTMFDFCKPKERVDSPTFGHGAGMLLRPDIIEKAIDAQEALHGPAYKIFFSPQGKKLDQVLLRDLALIAQEKKHIMLLPARYEGMDARVEEHYGDCLISLGDFVLMGGDLPAMVLMEGLLRLIPGVVGKQASVEHESFTGPFLDYPEYTSPVVWKGYSVPEVVRSGDHGKIQRWRQARAIKNTVLSHFDWLRSHVTTDAEIKQAAEHIPHHYAILMHAQVALLDGQEGTSSVTSIDIHDIARSSATYGIKKYFIVTPLEDQQKIVTKLLDFWKTGEGVTYNPHRHNALENVLLVSTLDEAVDKIKEYENADPILIGTAAKKYAHAQAITYHDQSIVWSLKRPVVLLFGTARGLGSSVIERCEFLLGPLYGFSTFNHLSVRSAAAIIFDRWLGITSKKSSSIVK